MGVVVIEHPDQPDRVAVHAAGSDLDAPGDQLPVTAGGLDTTSMITNPWQPPGPGSRWYPTYLVTLVCPRCDQAVRRT
ncbi:hypothetical protein ACIRVF_42180 [Kitasatospora sp. NPDC101157]|uniref:hypothetical protein n=1 Tax=Kitasatospora sp. NPDC101157 TaxID=3364098 RepID=UPI0038033832